MTVVDKFNTYETNSTYINITTTTDNANDPELADLVSQMTGFYLVGGDELRLICTLAPDGVDSLVLTAIKKVLRNGGVIVGTSAGTNSQVRPITVRLYLQCRLSKLNRLVLRAAEIYVENHNFRYTELYSKIHTKFYKQ